MGGRGCLERGWWRSRTQWVAGRMSRFTMPGDGEEQAAKPEDGRYPGRLMTDRKPV